MAGEVVALWLKRFRGGPMDPKQEVEAIADRGLRDNANRGGKRHVTIIDEAAWREAQQAVGVDVPPSTRRANVMLRGITFDKSTIGRMLRIGDARVRIYGETRPCEQMEEAQPGLRAAMQPRWRGGAFGVIVEGGAIRVGDAAEWLEEVEEVRDVRDS
ncbi:MAG: MOSC domain-containing protein [Acidobacteria bacterium]|nr:MOSC domain-containing protein [Acidobacteriota bacterium]MBV9475526.1 MOSC domain-containing protein [Acidobacteriota bacterium]